MASSSHTNGIGPVSQQYAAAATVPLIKSPSLWMPKPIELPNDVHPLPEDITAYFVYPFNLETHILSIQPQPHEAISQRRAENAQILHQRDVEQEQKEKEDLHKRAPGYNPASLLVPMSKSTPKPTPSETTQEAKEPEVVPEVEGLESMITPREADPMDELVSQLGSMDGKK